MTGCPHAAAPARTAHPCRSAARRGEVSVPPHVAADQLAAYIETPESRAVQDTPVGLRLAMAYYSYEA
jgi:hypothetical protein